SSLSFSILFHPPSRSSDWRMKKDKEERERAASRLNPPAPPAHDPPPPRPLHRHPRRHALGHRARVAGASPLRHPARGHRQPLVSSHPPRRLLRLHHLLRAHRLERTTH